MSESPVARIYGLAACVVAFGCVCSYVVDVAARAFHVAPTIASISAVVVGCLVPVSLLVRRRRAEVRAAVVIIVFVGGGIVANLSLYGATHDRLWEVAVTLLFTVPGVVFLTRNAYGVMATPTAREVPAIRVSAFAQVFMMVVFSLNLALWLSARHVDPSLVSLHEFTIATLFALIPSFPITAYFDWRRYRSAVATPPAIA